MCCRPMKLRVMVSKDGRPANSKSYMWIYRTGKIYKDTPIVLYEYQRTRKADHPREFLKGFAGVVVCDGYSAYRKLDRKIRTSFLLGAGRMQGGILRCIKSTSENGAKKRKGYCGIRGTEAIGAIYHQDNQLSDLEPDDRKKQRQMTVKPLVEPFFAWAKKFNLQVSSQR